MIQKSLFVAATCVAFAACSTDEFDEKTRTEASFKSKLSGDVSPIQWWKTTVTLRVNLEEGAPAKLLLMSGERCGTLYDYKEVTENGYYTLTIPQGKDTPLYLVCLNSSDKAVVPITLSGKSEEKASVCLHNESEAPEVRRASGMRRMTHSDEPRDPEAEGGSYDPNVNKILHGKSILGGAHHTEFTLGQKLEIADMFETMISCMDAKKDLHLNCDYELESKGPFKITFMTGYEASQTEHLLGYYYHSPGTYEDIKFVDISETHKYDIIDGFAKVQYSIRDTSYQAHSETGILPNKWYDANFDMKDFIGATTALNAARIGDQAYNAMSLFKLFTTGVSHLRGVSFTLDVPEGMHAGFYLKMNEEAAPEQWELLNSLGIKGIGRKSDWKQTNFCAEMFNCDQTHRSCIIPYEHTCWMGMEDVYEGGDHDCNDVMFGISSHVEILKPKVIIPDINLIVDTSDRMPWTIAYEDVKREADFDFNDAVIQLMPDYENELCCVTVQAAGSTSRMYLHYEAPDGTDMVLGEIHALLGVNPTSQKTVNTETSVAQVPFANVDCVPWPKDYTMANDAKRFWIEIQRGTCEDCTDAIRLAEDPGEIPEALLIAGEWKWPMEGVHIFSAYNNFPNWAKDASKIQYWNWYSTPKHGTTVNY